MSDLMTFPYSVEEFMERYKIVDTDGIYMSKGAELVPIFRMRQWFEHLPPAQRTGRWEYVKKRLVRGGYVDASECSVCHKRIMPHLKPNFCPNCGARMEEENG